MHVTRPDYYDSFACLAGDCPDTCCGSWRVVIDPDALSLYSSVGGALGEQLRTAVTEEEGEPCFAMEQGRCALLTADGLCAIQKALGEAALCRNCARYPRFRTEIGARRELGLSLSCPEAARLILSGPFTLRSEDTDEPMTDYHELSPELILTLRALRSRALVIAGDRSLPFGQRCARILALCAPADRARLDRDLAGALERGLAMSERPVPPAEQRETERFFRELQRTMGRLSYLQPAFRARMAAALACPPEAWAAPSDAWERLLCYGIYRYFPRAAFDRAIWPAAVFSILLPLLLRGLLSGERTDDADTLRRLAWTLSRELEHAEDNMARLFRAFRRRRFGAGHLPGIIAAIPD